MPKIQDTLLLESENFTSFTPYYSNLKASYITSLIDVEVFRRGMRNFKTKKEELLEVVIYSCFITLFSIKISDTDRKELREELFFNRTNKYRICGNRIYIPLSFSINHMYQLYF